MGSQEDWKVKGRFMGFMLLKSLVSVPFVLLCFLNATIIIWSLLSQTVYQFQIIEKTLFCHKVKYQELEALMTKQLETLA